MGLKPFGQDLGLDLRKRGGCAATPIIYSISSNRNESGVESQLGLLLR